MSAGTKCEPQETIIGCVRASYVHRTYIVHTSYIYVRTRTAFALIKPAAIYEPIFRSTGRSRLSFRDSIAASQCHYRRYANRSSTRRTRHTSPLALLQIAPTTTPQHAHITRTRACTYMHDNATSTHKLKKLRRKYRPMKKVPAKAESTNQ